MPGWLYETAGDNGLWVFLGLTAGLGGAAAWITGRAVARAWQSTWLVPLYTLLLALGVRFLHYALFEEPFMAPGNLAIDWLVLLAAGLLGFRSARAEAMCTQYAWLYQRRGLLGWSPRNESRIPRNSGDSE